MIRNFFEGKRQEEDEKSLRADVASLSVMSKLGMIICLVDMIYLVFQTSGQLS